MIRKILGQDDEVLQTACIPVTRFDEEIKDLLIDMWDTLYATPNGVGLAATQIGSRWQAAVIDTLRRDSSYQRLALVNPVITAIGGEETIEEGCLSIPGKMWKIPRATWALVKYQNERGEVKLLRARGMLARAVQHECDHLQGVLCNAKAVAEVRDQIEQQPAPPVVGVLSV